MAQNNFEKLYNKYNVPVPRYTSYPTVPDWDTQNWNTEQWKKKVKDAFKLYNSSDGLSLYIHLPFCESLCTYCGCNTRITKNHGVEIPYIQTVLKELDLYIALWEDLPELKEIHLGGGTPTFFSAQNLQILLNGIYERCFLKEDFSLSFEAHPANTSAEHLQILSNLGSKRLSLGVQDFDEKIQKVINRKQSFEDVKRVVIEARNLNYESVNLDLIYGLPFQTLLSINATIDKVLELMPERIAFYSYAHVPWKHPGQRAYSEKDLPSNEEKRALYDLGKEKLLQAGYIEIGMDHFALPQDELYEAKNKGKLHRNFMGYIVQQSRFLIGLGVSSISDVHFAYAQNVKTVEEYKMLIQSNQFALEKGHIMTDKEIVTRKNIHQVLCNKNIPSAIIETLDENVLNNFKTQIIQMEKEGIIAYNCATEEYLVQAQGAPFIRNIAALFDDKQLKQINQQKFSSSI